MSCLLGKFVSIDLVSASAPTDLDTQQIPRVNAKDPDP